LGKSNDRKRRVYRKRQLNSTPIMDSGENNGKTGSLLCMTRGVRPRKKPRSEGRGRDASRTKEKTKNRGKVA